MDLRLENLLRKFKSELQGTSILRLIIETQLSYEITCFNLYQAIFNLCQLCFQHVREHM